MFVFVDHTASQRMVDVVEVVPEKGVLGKQFRKEAKPLMDRLTTLSCTEIESMEKQLKDNG